MAKGLYADAIGREEEWLKERMETHLHPPVRSRPATRTADG